jgi:hypothetical protein
MCEFPIGSYVKLNSAVGSILVEGPNCRTYFWKRTIQWLFRQHLVLIEQMVSDKKIFMWISHRVLWTTGPIATKRWWNDPWMAPVQNCVRWSRHATNMAAKLKIEKGGMKSEKNILLWNYWANLTKFSCAAILVRGRYHQTQIWKRTIQWLFYQSLVPIE